ncbi:MAG: hypothetical protein OHK0029_18280 [Armatimonadaceae bacterium]
MELNRAQKRQMYDDGYLVVRGAVPRLMIEEARRAINHYLGANGLHPDDLKKFSAQSYCPDLQNKPVITDIFNKSPLFPLCESLVGEGNLLTTGGGQIALRFPRPTSDPAEPRGHIDGKGTGTNGIPEGEFRRGFTMLAVVLLSDLPEPYSGNFTVWPGSHRFFEKIFQEQGPAALAKSVDHADTGSDPVQITGSAGDVVICHHQIKHTAVPNSSPNIRYAAIFRGRHKDAEKNGVEAMTDIWREWPGVREVVVAE